MVYGINRVVGLGGYEQFSFEINLVLQKHIDK